MSLFPLGILSSSGGTSAWNFYAAPGVELTYNSIVYNPLAAGDWFLMPADGSSPTSYFYSNDGLSWTESSFPSSANTWRFIAGGSRLVGIRSNVSGGAVYYTDNGTTWTSATLPTMLTVNQGIYDGTRYLAVTTDSGSNGLVYDTDGAGTWTGIDVGSGGYAIAFDGTSRYVVMSATTTATHRTCTSTPTSAANWSNITLPASAAWRTVAYGNSTWVALQDGATAYATSTNGTTWTSRTLTTANNSANDAKMSFENGFFYYVGQASSTRYLMKSSDGISWTEEKSWIAGFDAAYSWASTSTRIIAAGLGATTGELLIGQ